MSDFARREVRVLDLFSLIVLLEQGDLDYIMADYWVDEYSGLNKYTNCLRCTGKRFVYSSDTDAIVKAALVERVKIGKLQFERVYLRTDLTRCPRCGIKEVKVVNPDWLAHLEK